MPHNKAMHYRWRDIVKSCVRGLVDFLVSGGDLGLFYSIDKGNPLDDVR